MSNVILNEYKLSDAYLDILRRYPVLTEAEEQTEAINLYEHDDRQSAEKLVLSNLRGVLYIVRQYSGYGLGYQDLIQEGIVGLMRAVRRFNPYRGVRLFVYSIPWVKAEIQSFIVKNWKIVKIATTDAKKKLFFGLRSLKQKLLPLSLDNVAYISDSLNIDKDTIRAVDQYMSGHDIAIDDEQTVLNLVDNTFTPEEHVLENEYQNHISNISNVLRDLDERSQDIIRCRYLVEPTLTLSELSTKWNVSIERIRQIENKALGTLKLKLPYFI